MVTGVQTCALPIYEISIEPRPRIRSLQQLMSLHRRPLRHAPLIDRANREPASVELEEWFQKIVRREVGGNVGVRPEDYGGRAGVLHCEEGMEEGDLARAEGKEVGSPVRVEDSVAREGHAWDGVLGDSGGKVEAVVA